MVSLNRNNNITNQIAIKLIKNLLDKNVYSKVIKNGKNKASKDCFFQTLSKQSFKIKDKSQKEEQEIK